jgi:hypothetical protein
MRCMGFERSYFLASLTVVWLTFAFSDMVLYCLTFCALACLQGSPHGNNTGHLQDNRHGTPGCLRRRQGLLCLLPVEEAYYPLLGLQKGASQTEELRARKMPQPGLQRRWIALRCRRRLWGAARVGYVDWRTARFMACAP